LFWFCLYWKVIADKSGSGAGSWDGYGQEKQSGREHLVELQTVFSFYPFIMSHYRQAAPHWSSWPCHRQRHIRIDMEFAG